MKLRIHVWGGLAGQLSGLSTAIWAERNLKRKIVLVFHTGGISRYEFLLGEVLGSIQYVQIDDHADLVDRKKEYRLFARGLASLKARMKLVVRRPLKRAGFIREGDAIDRELLRSVKPWTVVVRGYPSDWGIAQDSLAELQRRLSNFKESNFLQPAENFFLALHWRLGDYLQHPEANALHGTISPSSIGETIRDLVEPSVPVRIYTDDASEARKRMVSLGLPNSITIHSSDIWTDMFEMSSGRWFVGSNSGVSVWVALAMSGHMVKSAYLPSFWFKSDDVVDSLHTLPAQIKRYENKFD